MRLRSGLVSTFVLVKEWSISNFAEHTKLFESFCEQVAPKALEETKESVAQVVSVWGGVGLFYTGVLLLLTSKK
jgi:hypothetical protein